MSWRERSYPDDPADRLGRPGGDWQGVRPTFDNPMTWSIPLGRLFAIALRVHVVFVLYIVIDLGRAAFTGQGADASLAAVYAAALFLVVLVHELGHCLACRRTGGAADEILMWPLGGLAFCRPEPRWTSHLVTAAGGPAVNVVIFAILAPVLGLVTGRWWGIAVPNLFSPAPLDELTGAALPPFVLTILYAVHHTSFAVLLFNLLPVFPLDGGRILQAILWPRLGYVQSMRAAVWAGYAGAIALGVSGAIWQHWMLVAIAIFGGITCWMTIKQLEWTESVLGEAGDDDLYAASRWGAGEVESEPRSGDRATGGARRAHTEVDLGDSTEVDRILDKIADQGLASLSSKERQVLERATQRRRGREGG